MLVNFHLDHIFSTAEPFVTKLDMVMHLHGSQCHVKRLVCYLHGQGHSEGSQPNMTVSTISLELVHSFCSHSPNIIPNGLLG